MMDKPKGYIVNRDIGLNTSLSSSQLRELLGYGIKHLDLQLILLQKEITIKDFIFSNHNRVLRFSLGRIVSGLLSYINDFDGDILVDATQYSVARDTYLNLIVNNNKFTVYDCQSILEEMIKSLESDQFLTKTETKRYVQFLDLVSFDFSNWLEWGPLRGVNNK